jgi:hypothetical protein
MPFHSNHQRLCTTLHCPKTIKGSALTTMHNISTKHFLITSNPIHLSYHIIFHDLFTTHTLLDHEGWICLYTYPKTKMGMKKNFIVLSLEEAT